MPLLIIFAPAWGWVVFANVLLGINQGLCWSTTVIMKIDLVGPARRGLAMRLNEAAGYGAVSLAAIAAGYLAATYALRPQPFLLGIGFALAGLLLSLYFVRESHGHARHEAALLAHQALQMEGSTPSAPAATVDRPTSPSFKDIFLACRAHRPKRRKRRWLPCHKETGEEAAALCFHLYRLHAGGLLRGSGR